MDQFEWSFIYITASINTLLLAFVLLKIKRGRIKANKILSVVLLTWSYAFFYTWFIDNELYKRLPHFLMLGAQNTFLLGPLLYLYTVYASGMKQKFLKKDFLHFAPFIINTFLLIPFYTKGASEKIQYWSVNRTSDLLFTMLILLQIIHLTIYLAVIIFFIMRHKKNLRHFYSDTRGVSLDWLMRLSTATMAGVVLYAGFKIFFSITGNSVFYVNKISDIYSMLLIHIIAYMGILQPEIFVEQEVSSSPYLKSSLSDSEIKSTCAAVTEYLKKTKPILTTV